MFGDLKLLNLASSMARHAAARHEVLARNIANADTAGYRAKDLEPFSETYARAVSNASSASPASAGDAANLTWRLLDVSAPGVESPNGNTVSLEDQMVRSAETQSAHEAATAIYKKTMDILRLTLGRNL